MMNKKAEGTLKSIIISSIIAVFFVVAGVNLMYNVADKYPENIDITQLERFNNTFDRSSDLETTSNDLKNSIAGLNAEDKGLLEKIQDVLGMFILSAWGVFKNFFTTVLFLTGMIDDVGNTLPIPDWIIGTFTLLLTTVIAFAIYTLLFGREP